MRAGGAVFCVASGGVNWLEGLAADVGHGLAAGGGGSANGGRAAEDLAGDGGGDRGDLEGGDGIEGHGVAGADDGFAGVAGGPRQGDAGGEGAGVPVLVPAFGLDEGDEALAAVDVLIGDVGAAAGFAGRGVQLPADAVGDGEVFADFPIVLGEEVELLGALALGPEGDLFFAGQEGQEGVAAEIADEVMGDLGGDAEQVVDHALEAVEVV